MEKAETHTPVLDGIRELAIAMVGMGVHAILVSIGLAVLSFQFFEGRFLRLKKYFRYRFADSPDSIKGAPTTASLAEVGVLR